MRFENSDQKQKLPSDNFGQFCFWTHQNLDAACGSKSGLVFLDWCDIGVGEAGGGEGKRFRNCLMLNKYVLCRSINYLFNYYFVASFHSL